MDYLLGLQSWLLFEYAELTEAVRPNEKTLLSTCLIKLELVTLMIMYKIYSKQHLYVNLMKIIQKTPCKIMPCSK